MLPRIIADAENMRLNRLQQFILTSAFFVGVGILLFPPFYSNRWRSFHFITTPRMHIDWGFLALEMVIVGFSATALMLFESMLPFRLIVLSVRRAINFPATFVRRHPLAIGRALMVMILLVAGGWINYEIWSAVDRKVESIENISVHPREDRARAIAENRQNQEQINQFLYKIELERQEERQKELAEEQANLAIVHPPASSFGPPSKGEIEDVDPEIHAMVQAGAFSHYRVKR